MAQHDYILANQSGAAFRSDLNNGLAAIVSNNSGAAQPSTTYAYQWWAETNTGLLKIRNAANNAWITIGTLADANLGLLAQSGGTLTGALLADYGTAELPGVAFAGDPDTGVFRAGANKLGIATNGVERVEFGNAEVVFNDGGSNVDFRVEGATNADLFKIDAGLDQVQVANLNGGPLAGFRNRIINGNFDIWQRGTSTTTTGDTYLADRWASAFSTGGTVSQETSSLPTGSRYAWKFVASASNSFFQMGQQIEYGNCIDFQNTTVTISFMARAVTATAGSTALTFRTRTIAGVDGVCLFIGTNVNSTFTLTTSWTRYTVTRTLPATFGSLSLEFALGAHVSGDGIMLAQVQIEPGPVATPFEQRPIGTELALCRRYYEEVNGEFRHDGTLGGTNISVGHTWFATVPKRTTATVSVLSESGSNVSNILAVTAKGSNGAFCVWEYTDGTSIITRNKAAIIKFVAEL
jgi:hypothetical protein